MLRRCCAICLVFFLPLQSWAQGIDNLTFVSILSGGSLHDVARDQLNEWRAELEYERDRRDEELRQDEDRLQDDIDAVRDELQTLNQTASADSGPMFNTRSSLHADLDALDQALRDKKKEREQAKAQAEIQLAKIYLLQRWPDRRREVAARIEEGTARDRTHGDIDDIGHRKLVDNPDVEIPVGEQAIRQMIASGLMPIPVQDAAVQEYVGSLARRIASNSDLKTPLHVTVLDNPELSAAGLPGGFLLLSSGVVLAAKTESQLAGVIARQIAVIAAGQAGRASRRSIASRIFMPVVHVATSVLTGGISNAGAYYGVSYGLDSLGVLVDRTLTGTNEKYQKEADRLGIQYAWKAGFDPAGAVAFIDSLAAGDHPDSYRFLAAGPGLAERLLEAFAEVRYLPSKEDATVDSEAFHAIQEKIAQSASE